MNKEHYPPARRPARVWLVTLSLLLLVLTGTQAAHAQDAQVSENTQEPQMSDLLKLPGKVIAESDAPLAVGKLKVKNYRIEEVTLPASVEVEVKGSRIQVARAFRVTVTGGPFPVRALPPVIWIDDVAVGYGVESEDLDRLTAVTFDESLVHEGAAISVSYGDKEQKEDRTELPEKLKLNGPRKGGRQ